MSSAPPGTTPYICSAEDSSGKEAGEFYAESNSTGVSYPFILAKKISYCLTTSPILSVAIHTTYDTPYSGNVRDQTAGIILSMLSRYF